MTVSKSPNKLLNRKKNKYIFLKTFFYFISSSVGAITLSQVTVSKPPNKLLNRKRTNIYFFTLSAVVLGL
jgi:hypothetical protein